MARINPIETQLKNKTKVIVRNAEINDATALVNLKFEITKEIIYMLRDPDEFHSTIDNELNRINEMLVNKNKIYLVAEVQGEIVGTIDFETKLLRKIKHVGIIYMGIEENFRDMGIGSILLNTVIGWATSNPDIEKITLQVFSNNQRAIHLYKKLGFIMEGRCVKDMKFSDGTYVDSILMYMFVK